MYSRRRTEARAREILERLDVDIDVRTPVGELRTGQRQIVEIARALGQSARLLFLDEPTASLSHHESERLLEFVERLKRENVAIVYITHRLDEVDVVASRVMVLRDGRPVLDEPIDRVQRSDITTAIVGHVVEEGPALDRHPADPEHAVSPSLAWQDASIGDLVQNATVVATAGEVVGLYGKLGSGTSTLAESAYGVSALTGGALFVNGARLKRLTPRAGIAAGIGFLPAERKAGGAFLTRTVAENVCVVAWRRLSRLGFISGRMEAAVYNHWQKALEIRGRGPFQLMGTLSGGNQQKALIARLLEARVETVILLEPTRGVDVGGRADIYALLRKLAASGTAVLMVTSDQQEAVTVVDRCYVMDRGRVTAHLSGDDVTVEALTSFSGG